MPTDRKTADQWFAEFGLPGPHRVPDVVHWLCVPALFFSALGLLWSLPVPAALGAGLAGFRWSLPAAVLALMIYARVSLALALGLLGCIAICLASIDQLALRAPWPVWQVCAVLFAAAWLGELAGRVAARQVPSFRRDVQFILVGPAWLLSKIYRRLGIGY